jgi:acetyl-CoA acyltransferase
MSESQVLLSEDSGGVRTLTLNRPDRRNAINRQLWEALANALRAAARDTELRALVINGAGGSFCSGADITTPEDIHPRHKLRRLTDVALALHELAVPTIAKVTGVAVGAGWNLALGCDFVVATPESRFCQIFSKRGLSVDLGGSWLLPKLVGLQQAKRLVLLADMIDADEARTLGLVTWVKAADEIDAFVTELRLGWPQGRPSPWRRARRCSTTAPMRHCARRSQTRPARNRAISPPQTLWRRTRRSPRSETRRSLDDGLYHPDRSNKMRETVIVEAVRTPVGKRNGGLSDMHAADLSAIVLNALVERAGIDPEIVDDVVWGCVSQVGDQSSNIGRYSVLAAGWPETIPGTTINRACGSSQQALDFAVQAVMSGQQDVVVAGGVEVMSRVPLGSARATGMPYGPKVLARYADFSFNQGISAELIAQKWGFSRTRLDEYSARSHELAATAQDDGAFETQIMPVFTDAEPVVADEGIRRGTTVEKLAGLKPAFKEDGVIHAGNSSQISDGAAALLVMTAENAVAMGLTPMVRYRAGAVTGADPVLMLTGPIPATEKVLHKAGVGLGEVGVFEVNEAFAPVPLAWLAETGADEDKLNPLGGAIALGHPLGASGAVLMTRMINHMRDNGIRYGLQTMCEGGGTANATLVELIA